VGLDGSGRYDRFNSRANDSNDIFTKTLHVLASASGNQSGLPSNSILRLCKEGNEFVKESEINYFARDSFSL
jgi:hypothetical protein